MRKYEKDFYILTKEILLEKSRLFFLSASAITLVDLPLPNSKTVIIFLILTIEYNLIKSGQTDQMSYLLL